MLRRDAPPSSLDHRIPPPLLVLGVGAAMWFIARGDAAQADAMRVAAGTLLAIAGAAITVAGAREFRRAGTTIDPTQPERAATIVTTGIFRHSRNPMYLGFATLLAGWATLLASPLAWLGPVLFVAYVHRYQIRPEERVLAAKFGPAYEGYAASVRRWL